MYGAMIRRDDGSMWLSPDVTPLNMVQRFDWNVTVGAQGWVWQTDVPDYEPFMCFSRDLNNTGISWAATAFKQNGRWAVRLIVVKNYTQNKGNNATTLRFYVFSSYVPPGPNYSIFYFNAQGKMVWRGDMRPLQVEQRDMPSGAGIVDIGEAVAVCASLCGFSLESISPGVPSIYIYMTWAYIARGNTVERTIVDDLQTTQDIGGGYDVRSFFYIRTRVYDL